MKIQSNTEQAATSFLGVTFDQGIALIVGKLAQYEKRIARLESDLNECREYLEDQVDVVDGSYGEPSPNRAMQLVQMIDETLNGRPV